MDYIYQADPDFPNELSPLQRAGVNVKVGDFITHVNGVDSKGATDLGELLPSHQGDLFGEQTDVERLCCRHDVTLRKFTSVERHVVR